MLGSFFPVQNKEAKNVQGKHGDSKSYDDWNKKLFCFGVLSFSQPFPMSLFVDLAVILSYGSVELAAGTKFPRNAMKGTNDNSQWQDIAENGQTHEVGLSHLISIFFVWPSLSTVSYVEIWPVIEEIHDHVLWHRNDQKRQNPNTDDHPTR